MWWFGVLCRCSPASSEEDRRGGSRMTRSIQNESNRNDFQVTSGILIPDVGVFAFTVARLPLGLRLELGCMC